jgi:methionyl-tRNA synthetase
VDNKCPDCGRSVEKTKEESYFFKLSKYTQKLIDHIEQNPEFILPVSRANEMLSNFLRPGLEDLAVSRTSFKWGIPVPFDDKHIIYVWIDALSNYITAMNYLTEDQSDFLKYWPADVHVMAKEIVRFHTIIWPAMLMALDLPLPKQVFGHGWLVLEGGKMSKSKGNVVDPVILCNKYGTDAIRYFLLREVPFGLDGVFSNEALINRINSDLANDLGNLVSRTVAMVEKYFGGTLPAEKQFDPVDQHIRELASEVYDGVINNMENYNSPLALTEIWKLVSRTNKYIDETAPWILAKDESNKERLCAVLYNLCESLRIIAVLIKPFMPTTSDKIFIQIGVMEEQRKTLDSAKEFGGMNETLSVQRGEVLFPRIDVTKELEELNNINK